MEGLYIKKLITVVFTMSVVAASTFSVFAGENRVQATSTPGTLVTYDENLNAKVEKTTPKTSKTLETNSISNETIDTAGRAKEDELFENAGDGLKVYNLEPELPVIKPGMSVLYGDDGGINKIFDENGNIYTPKSSRANPSYPGRAAVGVYTYGSNKITIKSNSVLGEGRMTVYRSGVGGSGSIGSSGKTLAAGDVATKMAYDNPKHGTALTVRDVDSDIVKTMYKNDIGTLPDAVLDIYFWGYKDYYFGKLYKDTVSWPNGRYYYSF